ncbi:hypothetical protein E2K93_08275 [Thalassotalea sp. HSM 43]|uniref:hypothetical protein n=1 Tax=Thalassotalea sp. HSM 43 TaxID=2552945 RepID=UPI0010812861|nr:hypothetical protein [Thalassotalea sp. HSM 43]QBY04386.1 hypothetical protein E2K93_08275 [Thalassotalea sp. HSM 43]
MLSKLKKIKFSLLNERNISKYLMYAIGEIILIVIGILVALHFNNMNISRQSNEVERQYYQAIKAQLAEDRAILKEEAADAADRKKAFISGKNIINGNSRDRSDELAGVLLRLIDYGDFRRSSNVYQTLVSSGEIKYIKNNKIIDDLQEIERAYEIIERLEQTQANVVMTHTAPAILQITDIENVKIINQDIAFTKITSNRFVIAIKLVDEKIHEFNDVVMRIDGLSEKISIELDKDK